MACANDPPTTVVGESTTASLAKSAPGPVYQRATACANDPPTAVVGESTTATARTFTACSPPYNGRGVGKEEAGRLEGNDEVVYGGLQVQAGGHHQSGV